MSIALNKSESETYVIDLMYAVAEAMVLCKKLDDKYSTDKEQLEETLAKSMSFVCKMINGDTKFNVDGERSTVIT